MLPETLRNALRTGKAASGCAVASNSPEQVEILALAGFDFVFLDAEHWPLSDRELLDAIFIGTTDLSNSLGVAGQRNHPAVNAAVCYTMAKAKAAGEAFGALVRPEE